jgi:putative acetyltransferase
MSTPSIVIRPERPDHPQVRALLRQLDAYLASLYEPEENHVLDEPTLMAPDVTFLVASDDQHILGCGAVRRMPAEVHTQQRPYGEVKRMMVDPRARGHRIGARLLQALEALLRADRIELALLETGAQQVEAVRLYERNGYRRRASFGGYPDNGLSVFYEKALSQ